MKQKIRLLLVFLFLCSLIVSAEEIATAVIKAVDGKVEVDIFGNKWEPACKGIKLYQSSKIRTYKEAFCVIDFSNKRSVKLKPESEVMIEELSLKKGFFSSKQKIKLNLKKGFVLSKVKKLKIDEKFIISTPTAVCGVRGTQFSTEFNDKTTVSVLEGVVETYNPEFPEEKVFVEQGQFSTVIKGQTAATAKTMSNDQLKKVTEFSKREIINTVPVNLNIYPEFIKYYFKKIDKNKFRYTVKIKNIDSNKQKVNLLLYVTDKEQNKSLVGKYGMNLVEGDAKNIESSKTFEVEVLQAKSGKYSYKFNIE